MLNVGLLWHTSEIFHKVEKQRPRPNGLMDQLTSPKNTITVLPLIDFNPSDESCICSTLLCITEHAKHVNIEIYSTNLCELKHLNSQN